MRAYVELPVFLALAAGLHIAVVLPGQLVGGVTSGGGVGGDALLSIHGSSASIAAMVQRWEDVPEVTADLEMAEAPPTPDVVPDQPMLEPAEALSLAARLENAPPPLPMLQRDDPIPLAEAPPAKPTTPEALAVETSPPRPPQPPRPDDAVQPEPPAPQARPEPPRPTPAPPRPPHRRPPKRRRLRQFHLRQSRCPIRRVRRAEIPPPPRWPWHQPRRRAGWRCRRR